MAYNYKYNQKEEKEVLYRMDFNESNFLLVTKSTFNDKEYVDCRKYFTNEKGQDIATKKGLTMSFDDWFKLATMLLDIIENESNGGTQEVKEKAQDEEPDTSDFDYRNLDAITLNDGNNIFSDSEFPF